MKTAELTGAMLDYWVAQAEGVDAVMSDPQHNGSRGMVTFYSRDEDDHLDGRSYKPSEHWSDGGPIIERDQIFLTPPSHEHSSGGPNAGWKNYAHWRATVSAATRTLPPANETQAALNVRPVGRGTGETALIAAMRAKVASHYGDEVPDDRPTAQGAG